jgi:tetratricopeptide (TPR) repeat protein
MWPDEVLHFEYSLGWFLTDRQKFAPAAEWLRKVQETAPEFLKTRLLLAECYMGLGREQEALQQLQRFMQTNPYETDAYLLLARVDPGRATRALEGHVLPRLQKQPNWIVQDYATADEIRVLLHLYVRLNRAAQARELVNRAAKFYSATQVEDRVDPLEQVRALARTYEEHDRPRRAQWLRRVFPEAWDQRKSGRKRGGPGGATGGEPGQARFGRSGPSR